MGLFGGKEVFVASTVYNMAGDITERVDYLKTTIASSVIGVSNFSMSDTIQKSYLNGPSIKARSFYRWAQSNYPEFGTPSAYWHSHLEFDMAVVESQIPHDPATEIVEILDAKLEYATVGFMAEQFMIQNYPSQLGTAWRYDAIRFPTRHIRITFADGSTVDIPNGSELFGRYFHVTYLVKRASDNFPLGSRMWIYKVGSGNAVMDSLPIEVVQPGRFLPFIPIRVDNNFLSNSYMPTAYAAAKRAYKKATGQKFDDLVAKIEDNPDLDDIDHCYMVYGVTLNTKEKAAKRYLFKFFTLLAENQYGTNSQEQYNEWRMAKLPAYNANAQIYQDGRHYYFRRINGSGSAEDPYVADDPATTTHAPTYPSGGAPRTFLTIRSVGTIPDIQMQMTIKWRFIMYVGGEGQYKPGAKPGDVWLEAYAGYDNGKGAIQRQNSYILYDQFDDNITDITQQLTPNSWRTIRVFGLVHENYPYKDRPVTITGAEALADTEESGFICPIDYSTLKSMSLIDSTQMMTAGTYLVFNSYKVVKQKWYQTAAFKIFIFVAIIAITVVTGGAGAASVGLLGANAAVGAALGFTALAAVIVGAVANAIAAMILMKLIERVSIAAFGDKIGAIIAAVASIVAMNVGTAFMNGQSMASIWGNMLSAQNIIGMTSAVGNGVAGYAAASAQQWQMKTEELTKNYAEESAKITQQYINDFGLGKFAFDPLQLTEVGLSSNFEEMSTFLTRTLMTGSDIADMTLDMLNEFPKYSLNMGTIGSGGG